MKQKVTEVHANGQSLQDRINEKIDNHADDGFVLREITMIDRLTVLLLFEREGEKPAEEDVT